MKLSRKEQIEFTKEILALIELSTKNPEQLQHLSKLASLLVSWAGSDNGVAVNLSEYVGELTAITSGSEDDGWKDEFKKTLYEEIDLPNK
ncbi:hypothetical protein ACFRMN_19680 [Streptomyces sp. NPDC056835]|uniref:hypothetical protein n=1 Tax=Streptomyces sp. NPDC056835 TaxID=3345956 RepID=UPI00367A1E56